MIISLTAAGFINFDYDPPHVRAYLLGIAADAHKKATKLSRLSAMTKATLSLRQARTRTTLAPIGIGLVGAVIYTLVFYFVEMDPSQRAFNFWVYFFSQILSCMIWFVYTAAALWAALDRALVFRTRAIRPRQTVWWIVVVSLGVYLLLTLTLSQSSPSDRL